MEIFRTNLYEIKKSGSLKMLGGIIALCHFLQFCIWYSDAHTPLRLVQQDVPMCWSLFESCDWLRVVPLGLLKVFYYSYGVTACLAALVLLLSELVAFGYTLLVLSSFFGVCLYFQDLRLSSNDGFFIFLASFTFLLMPSKHRLMRGLVVSFFVARGMSQASPDWLTGNWYIEHLRLPIKLAEWFAALSVLIQMIGGACLLFRDSRFFLTGWISLLVFACAQLYMGEILQPCIAIGALAYVLFDEFELRKAEREYLYQSFIRPEPSILWGGILLAIFWLAQLMPLTGIKAGSSLHQLLDVWALHPEAAQEDCEQKTFAIYQDRIEEVVVEALISRQASMACNTYIRYLDLKSMCRSLKEKDAKFVTISSEMRVRNYREKSARKVFEVQDFCAEDLTFKRLGEVQWNTNPAK
jgi:hypothetical protein